MAPRRRETGDSVTSNSPSTGGGSRFFRSGDESTASATPSLLRRKTELANAKAAAAAEDNDQEDSETTSSPFDSLKRSSTNPVGGSLTGASSSSPWQSASHSASFSPMGAFGTFAIGGSAAQTPTSEKKAGGLGSLRGESRLKGLFSKESSEDLLTKEKSSLAGSLERLTEDECGARSNSPWVEPTTQTRTGRSETNPFLEEPRSGSAALIGGSQEVESTLSQGPDLLGMSAFGMTPSSVPGFRDLMQNHDESSGGGGLLGHEPASPTTTNPYQSPHGDKTADIVDDLDIDGSDVQQVHHAGITGLRDPSGPFGPLRMVGSRVDVPSVDRSQTSSVGTNRGFSSLGGLGGGLSGLGSAAPWSTAPNAVGTPSRERSAFSTGFGDPIFGPMSDLQSPSLSGLGGGIFAGGSATGGAGSVGRSSKLGSLFPSAMQEQMQGDQISAGLDDFSMPTGELDARVVPPLPALKC